MFSTLLFSILMAGILTVTMMHAPLFLKRLFYYLPAWVQAGLIHFGYGGWLGGVTGHVFGACLSLPMFASIKYFLQPRFKLELDKAWERNWFNIYIWTPLKARLSAFGEYFMPAPALAQATT